MAEAEEQQQYIEGLEQQLEHWRRAIDELGVAIESAAPQERPRLQRLLAELKDRRRTVEVRLEELRAFTRIRWRDLRENVERARHEFETALEDARARTAKKGDS